MLVTLAITFLAVAGISFGLIAAQEPAVTDAASDVALTEPLDITPSPTAPQPTISRPITAPMSNLRAGSESRYSGEYFAHVDAAALEGLQVHVTITASGRPDLRRPESSCLVVVGADGQTYLARPTEVALTIDEAGYFVGRLSFPALISGTYGLQYSCSSDYSTADIGSVDVPSVGVSRYSDDYYAVVLGFDEKRVYFAAHGRSDLRAPESSCIALNGQSVTPMVALEARWAPAAITLVGTMDFPIEVAGSSIVYSCSGYSEVLLD